MSLKKILQLRSSIGFYGAENVVMELAKGLLNSEYLPIVGVLQNSHNPHVEMVKVAKEYGIENKVFPCSGRFSIRTTMAIRRFALDNDIKIVHAHGYKADFYAYFATLGTKVKRIATCHPWLDKSGGFQIKIYTGLDKLFLVPRFHRLVAISDEMRKEILHTTVSPSKIITIQNGVDLKRFSGTATISEARKRFGIPEATRVIGTVGRLSTEKGHACLLRAAQFLLADFTDLAFMFVGDGPQREPLAKQVADWGLQKKIFLTGICTNIPQALAAMEIFALPSLTEGLPMALLEAMAARKAIVATSVGTVPEVIRHNYSGLLVSPDDPFALAASIKYLLEHPLESKVMGERAHSAAVAAFSTERMAQNYVDLYDELLYAY